MSTAPMNLGLPHRGLVHFAPDPTPGPESLNSWFASALDGLRFDSNRSLRPWPGVAAFLSSPDALRVQRLFNILWGDNTSATVRHVANDFHETTTGAWTARSIAALTGASAADTELWGSDLCPGNTGKGYYLMSRRIADQSFYWTGTGNITQLTVAGSGLAAGRHVANFADRAWVFNQIVGGSIRARRAQWSIPGDALTWTGTGSGSREMSELPGEITGVVVSNRFIYLFSEYGILAGENQFDVDNPVRWETIEVKNLDIGLWASNSIISRGSAVDWLSRGGFRSLGPQGLQNIGEPINKEVLSRINPNAIQTVTSVYWPEPYDLAVWALPMDGATTPNELWAFETKANRWHRIIATGTGGYFSVSPTALAFESRSGALACNDAFFGLAASNNCDDAFFVGKTCQDFGGGATKRILSGHSNGSTNQIDDTATHTSLLVRVRTPNWTFEGTALAPGGTGRPDSVISPDELPTLHSIGVTYRPLSAATSSTLHVLISTNGGASYVSVGTLTLAAGVVNAPKRVDLGVRITAKTISIELVNSTLSAVGGTLTPARFKLDAIHLRVGKSGEIRIAT